MSKDNITHQSTITLSSTKDSGITDALSENSLITQALTKSSYIGIETPVGERWILSTGFWEDLSIWIDTELWKD